MHAAAAFEPSCLNRRPSRGQPFSGRRGLDTTARSAADREHSNTAIWLGGSVKKPRLHRMGTEDKWTEVTTLLELLTRLSEQQPDEDDPAFVFSYVPQSALGPTMSGRVNLSLGPAADDVWIMTGPSPIQVLQPAIEAVQRRLDAR